MNFQNGGIVSGNIEIELPATCGYCRKRLDAKRVQGEMLICDSCSEKHFGVKREENITEQQALDRLGISKIELDEIKRQQHDQCLFNCDH